MEGIEPSIVVFSDESLSHDGIIAWLWNFADGHTSNLSSPSHIFSQEGNFTINLTVYETDGDTNTFHQMIRIHDTDPAADFIATPRIGALPLIVNFSESSSSYDGIQSWRWDFGDGSTSTEQRPVHEYLQNGEFTVVLTILEPDGDESTEVKTGLIIVNESRMIFLFSLWAPVIRGLSLLNNSRKPKE
jgi:PKD repeat protein